MVCSEQLFRGKDSECPCSLYIDAGISNLHLNMRDFAGNTLYDAIFPSNSNVRELVSSLLDNGKFGKKGRARVFITGKLANTIQNNLGCGKVIMPAAALWLAARDLIKRRENDHIASLAIIDLSASGYMLVGVDRNGELVHDLLTVNPRCGAGSGINLDRVLQKLAIDRGKVDDILVDYLGEAGRNEREKVIVRADRCGVFASSATISDKNQGIPLAVALATTLKSEVLKACKKLPADFSKAYLSGRIFRWQYARDCASDFLRDAGVKEIAFDVENSATIDAMHHLAERLGTEELTQTDHRLLRKSTVEQYPSFGELKARYEANGHYLRMEDDRIHPQAAEILANNPVIIGLDVGSTMAKVVIADAASGDTVFQSAYSNSGDTIETIKQVFVDLMDAGREQLSVANIGITGSARYQVQQALLNIYPALGDRVSVLVENYAHARGSINHVRQHIRHLRQQGHDDVNEEFCILIDIGGEDTKISTIALRQAELFDNAMNLKCSAGTGSLMDTLAAMFNIASVAEAGRQAFAAPQSFAINATCAVFLMENASKLQAQGVPKDQILASANWAIVENMARTLWSQLELPGKTVVLLHGQTMLSEPLPLAVTHRLHDYLGQPIYALVPPQPGHRACIGLVRTLLQAAVPGHTRIALRDFVDTHFEKRVILCKGAACGDPSARCNRCSLSCRGDEGKKVSFTLGGCTAINELLGRKKAGKEKVEQSRDAYKEIWDFIDSHHPRSDDPRRLVIPRSFAVSEWAYFLARIFSGLGIPVHVDNVREQDLLDAQPDFNIDSCAPHIGAVGQYRRLAAEPHGMILAVQIEDLPTQGMSKGSTCTTNQGGIAVACNLAGLRHPQARFHYLHLKLGSLDADDIGDQLFYRLQPLFEHYGISPSTGQLRRSVTQALQDRQSLRDAAAGMAADFIEEALAEKRQVAIVVGREYILNPGIYDSHVQRLLRDKHMAAIPSYVLDIELDEAYRHIYWRNPHFIVSLLNAVSQRKLHQRLHNERLATLFQSMETDPEGTLLPVVQISTFSCGPDSVIAHYIAEIMKQRPFLVIQSDAVIKELAHLENRVNTYVKQLEQGLHGKLHIGGKEPFRIQSLNRLTNQEPLNKETDVLFFPTLGDNRVVTSVMRGAGFTCLDNYDDDRHDLSSLAKEGRKLAGDAVCTPLAAIYADMERGVRKFIRLKETNDPSLIGKTRLLYFDSQGSGPCRQGQYPYVHRLLYSNSPLDKEAAGAEDSSCNALPGGGLFQLLLSNEEKGYNFGIDEWVLLRGYQGIILQGVLHDVLFRGAANCRDYEQYQEFMADYRRLKAEIFERLESFYGPGRAGQWLLRLLGNADWAALPVKYFLYRLHGQEFKRPLRDFVTRWKITSNLGGKVLKIWISGEGYMRVSQAEDIFHVLLASLGFRRFELSTSPLLSYLEYLLDEVQLIAESRIRTLNVRKNRKSANANDHRQTEADLRQQKNTLNKVDKLRFLLRRLLAAPLYAAARQKMPPASADLMKSAKEILPTQYPTGELVPYVGEALHELQQGVDLFLNVGPTGCMVSSMGELLTPRIMRSRGVGTGRIQNLFSAEGDVDAELLTLAVLKATGPEGYYQAKPPAIS